MPIPDFRTDKWLPEGHHSASWDEITCAFQGAPGSRREAVMRKLLTWREKVISKGITGLLILNGSFISATEEPSDFDAVLVYDAHVDDLLKQDEDAKKLLDYSTCKEVGFDLLIFSADAARKYPQFVHLDVFDKCKKTGVSKGVLEVAL